MVMIELWPGTLPVKRQSASGYTIGGSSVNFTSCADVPSLLPARADCQEPLAASGGSGRRIEREAHPNTFMCFVRSRTGAFDISFNSVRRYAKAMTPCLTRWKASRRSCLRDSETGAGGEVACPIGRPQVIVSKRCSGVSAGAASRIGAVWKVSAWAGNAWCGSCCRTPARDN